MKTATVLLALLVVLSAVGCGAPPRLTTGYVPGPLPEDVVRVGLLVAVAEAPVATASTANWVTAEGGGALPAGECIFREREGRIEIENEGRHADLGPGPVRLRGSTEWGVGGDRFAGDLLVQRAVWGGVTVVNLVDVEEYLRGVVPWEIGRPEIAALEAVKAQAIAARTYTMRHLGRWADLGFDVYADTRDQVYRGRTGTAEITDRAVGDTRGQVVVFGDDLVRAYYSSTCGGHTSTLTDVWDRDGAPYLQGRRDADAQGRSWCRESPQFRWVEAWSAHELGDGLRANLAEELGYPLPAQDFGVLQGLKVLERDASGRVALLEITTDRNRFEVWGDRIRWVLRPAHSRFSILRSTLFEIEEDRREGVLGRIVVRGGGFGHGVGLCQTGALGRARAGQSAEDILGAYYPGARVEERTRVVGPS